MSIEDEIKQAREKMQKEQAEAKQKEIEAQRLKTALERAGMSQTSPRLIMPSVSLISIINETMPNMRFDAPKVVRKMPDGITRARIAERTSQRFDHSDENSFDALLYSQGSGKDAISYHLWVFRNGAVAIVRNTNCNATLDDVQAVGVGINEIRAKIIEALAQQSIKYPKRKSTSTPNTSTQVTNKKQGCYIATAVYGNYDCPPVWTLRRYRDLILAKSWYGRIFINIYYKTSPLLVKYFGKSRWFISIWKIYLDKKVDLLNQSGVSNNIYYDK